MGGQQSKGVGLPISVIVKRLDECICPDERGPILDYLEMLESKLLPVTGQSEFKEAKGVPIVIRVLRAMFEDDVVIRMSIAIFDVLKENTPLVMDIIQFGGLELIEKIKTNYEKDPYISITAPHLLKQVLEIGAKAAISEIKLEETNLQLCQKCQEIVERARRVTTGSTAKTIPKPSDRVNRVIMFMSNYPKQISVLCAALDAMILYVKNPDAQSTISDTFVVPSCLTAATNNEREEKIIWRVSFVLSVVASFGESFALDIVKGDIHELITKNYHELEDPRTKQQILWLLSSLLRHRKSKRYIHKSELCMNLFIALAEKRANLSKQRASSLHDKLKPFDVVAPLEIRTFLRESGGVLLIEDDGRQREKRKFKERRNFEDKPRFGVSTLEGGESGLIDVEKKVDLNETPWLKNLDYESGAGKRKKKPPVSIAEAKVAPSNKK